jgi:Tfp pilus assembly protein PilF
MRRAFLASSFILLALLPAAAGCRSGGDFTRADTQRDFGVKMAKMNLWREAMFRFQRAVQIAPDDAMAHSNLAVALEANGDFDGAAKEYREALRLDRSNQYIQKNYSRFVEFTQKSKKREAKAPAAAADSTAATTAAPSPAAPAVDAAAPAAPATPPMPAEPVTDPIPPAGGITTTNPPEGEL